MIDKKIQHRSDVPSDQLMTFQISSFPTEAVVGESVVVIKKLLQMQPTEHKDIIMHMAKLADTITVAMARASILWLIGEYSDRVPKIAPDVLRKMAKGFINEVSLDFFYLMLYLCTCICVYSHISALLFNDLLIFGNAWKKLCILEKIYIHNKLSTSYKGRGLQC